MHSIESYLILSRFFWYHFIFGTSKISSTFFEKDSVATSLMLGMLSHVSITFSSGTMVNTSMMCDSSLQVCSALSIVSQRFLCFFEVEKDNVAKKENIAMKETVPKLTDLSLFICSQWVRSSY